MGHQTEHEALSQRGADFKAALTAYDQVAYPGHAYPQTHPTRLGAMAQLLGLTPAPVERCRVLELACGDGANLIPMAVALPGATFVGVDVAARAIAAGQEIVAELGLRNIELRAGDASALGRDLGEFDYVIAHGVYSWVPEAVRDGLLATIKAHLAPGGIGYVSFSAYPGAYFRELVRELMLFHTGEGAPPTERLQHGIDFLRFVREVHGPGTAYAAALDQELVRVSKADPGYVFHDDFSETNAPIYFSAFAEHLATHDLAYLCDATFDYFFDPRLSSAVREQISSYAGGNIIAEQQYLDFIQGTPFRQTLACHASAPIDRKFDATRLFPLLASAWLAPTQPDPDILGPTRVCFRSQDLREIETEEPLAKALLLELSQAWPEPRSVQCIFDSALRRIGAPPPDPSGAPGYAPHALRVLERTVLMGAATRLISVWHGSFVGIGVPGDRPLASPLARLQASRGELVTSLRHTTVRLQDAPARGLLELMDGTRTRQDLLVALRDRLAEFDPTSAHDLNLEALNRVLNGLAERGFVLG